VLARLVAETALARAEPVVLLALLKHPLAGFGRAPAETHRAAQALERAVLRGPRLAPGLAALRHALQARRAERDAAPIVEESRHRARFTEAARVLPARAWDAAADILTRVDAALGPLEALAASACPVPLATLATAHEAAVAAVMVGASAGAEEEREALAQIFEELRTSAPVGPTVRPRDYPGLFAALIERAVVRRSGGLDPRIHIWGALEARLQSVDVVVLGGLNEGTWPGRTRLDPLLSRPMRTALALEPPERRIGLAAHDFAQALGHRQVWISRADRQDGEPRVASRWLQRLLAYAGEGLAEEMRARGRRMLALARSLDAPVQPKRLERPHPSPPPELRPKRLSATQIETLIRDPYAIHARHVLRLRPLEALGTLPDASERGTLIHDVLERFVRERPRGPFDEPALDLLLAIGREEFARWSDFPAIATLWWPRFERVARWFVRVEAARGAVDRHVENSGRMLVGAEFELTARADRLDMMPDGTIGIVDYKTGTPPSNDEVLSLAPQLPLEALIAESGGFAALGHRRVGSLEYYHISGRGEGGAVCARGVREREMNGKPAISLAGALAEAKGRLEALVAYFADPGAEYLSRKIPRRGRVFAGDYDHLARVAEWSVSGDLPDEVPR
jgi:ATP-dependent helicase/nuclease subunit B